MNRYREEFMNTTNMLQKPIKSGDAILQYIPQRPPFVMVDKVYEQGERHLLSGFLIVKDNCLCREGAFQEGGLIENIAQTAALYAGMRYEALGEKPSIGFIAGIKNLEVHQLPKVGEQLHTHIQLTHEVGGIQVVEGKVYNTANTLVAHCELKIFINSST